MAEKIKLKISPAVAAIVRPGVSTAEKLQRLEMALEMAPIDQVLLIYCMMKDADVVIKGVATVAFGSIPVKSLTAYISMSGAHPSVLDAITRHYYANPDVVAALLGSEALTPQAHGFLQRLAALNEQVMETVAEDESTADDNADNEIDETDPAGGLDAEVEEQIKAADDFDEDESTEIDEQNEEYLSKYKMAQLMGISEKIKMALSGDKEWRSILIKDANKLVSGSVIKNPRITEAEIHTLIKSGVQNDEIMRLICANKEWIKNYKIRKALVENPRTPVQNALRYLATLGVKDIAAYAKSKNISSVISTQAKRLMLSKKR